MCVDSGLHYESTNLDSKEDQYSAVVSKDNMASHSLIAPQDSSLQSSDINVREKKSEPGHGPNPDNHFHLLDMDQHLG